MEVMWDWIGFGSAVAAVVCFPMGNCSKALLGESRSWVFWKATTYMICNTAVVLFVLFARELGQLRYVRCLSEKWRHLNPPIRTAASFMIMIGTTLYSCIDESKEKPDTVSVIFAVVAALASICTARHITLLGDVIFFFLALVIAFMYKINKWHGVAIGTIISSVIIVVYCCISDPHPH